MLRLEYLFALTHVCHVTPAASWDLLVTEFALLLKGIDEQAAAMAAAAAG